MQSALHIRSLVSDKIKSLSDLEKQIKPYQNNNTEVNNFIYYTYETRRKLFVEFFPFLIAKGGNPNELYQLTNNLTIFMKACMDGQSQIVRKMLEFNIDLTLEDKDKNNCLLLTLNSMNQKSIQSYFSIIKLLLQKNSKLADSKNKTKHALIIAGEFHYLPIIKLVVQKLQDLSHKTAEEETILHLLAKKFKNKQDQTDVIKLVLDKKINIQSRNSQGRSALQLVDAKYKSQFQQLIKPYKDQKKRSKHDVGKEILKSNNKLMKNNIKLITINEKQEQYQQQAGQYTIQALQEKLRQLKQQKTKKELLFKQIQAQEREMQIQRSNDWIISSDELKYYLEEEIKLFSKTIQERNNKDKQQYDTLIKIITETLESELNVQVKVYGSFATRLCLIQSDIDVVVISNEKIETVPAAVDLLEKIDEKLKKLDVICTSKFIKSASIPVIKVTCSEQYNYKKIDITLQNTGHNGLDCVNIIRQYMQKYKQLTPLTFVLKTFIYSSNLYDTYQGGLSSYGLILMIVAILQGYEAIKKDDQKIMVSELIIKFLWCYGFQFDYINKAIFVQHPSVTITRNNYKGFWVPLSYVDIDTSPKLFLVDPMNIHNNVGRSTHQIKQVQKAFSNAYTIIHTNYSCNDRNCEYRKQINSAEYPQQMKNKRKAKPCCILKRMFQCSKHF